MTCDQIAEQIADIREVTAKAKLSKEAAAAFLISAGIIDKDWNLVHGTPNEVVKAPDSTTKSMKPRRKTNHEDSTVS